jgi:hypothetical protein
MLQIVSQELTLEGSHVLSFLAKDVVMKKPSLLVPKSCQWPGVVRV